MEATKPASLPNVTLPLTPFLYLLLKHLQKLMKL